MLFIWSASRVVPVRVTEFSITEEAFDVALNPIRAKVSLGLRVMTTDDLGFDHRGGSIFINHLRTREALAGKTGAASLQSLGLTNLAAVNGGERRHDRSRPTPHRRRRDSEHAVRAAEPLQRRGARGAAAPRPSEPGVVYVRRRFIPAPGTLDDRRAARGRRRWTGPTLLGAKYLGDPLLYWRIADANAVVDPNELTDTLGRRVDIPLPPGM